MLTHPEVVGNTLKLLVDNTNLRPQLLDDIKNATSVINAQEFIWTNDGLGREVADLLKVKAGEGLEVNMQLDGTGSGGFPFGLRPSMAKWGYKHFVKEMREAGVNVIENWRYGVKLPEGTPKTWDHRKLFTIDGKIAYLGGINLSADYEKWHDTMVRLEGPVAAQAGAEFLGRWVDLGGHVSERQAQAIADAQHGAALLTPGGEAITTGAARIITNSHGAVRDLTNSYIADIRAAKTRLWITSPSIGNPEIVNELIAAKKANPALDVRVITTSFKSRDGDPFTRSITSTYIDQLVANDVKVWEYPRTIHAKVMLSDDTATVSSFNMNVRSAKKDLEVGLRANDVDFTKQVETMLNNDFPIGRPVARSEGQTAWRQALMGLRHLFHISF